MGTASKSITPDLAKPSTVIGRYRWTVCALLFFATTINYMDRQIIAILKPLLQSEIRWNEIDYSNIVFAFQLAYAVALLFAGKVMDWLGTRKGFSLSIALWSVAAMAHALAHSVFGFGFARFILGIGESGNFPASIKAVAEWFPKRERALATGVFNSGTNIGAIITPLVVPWLTRQYGWRAAFITIGAVGFVWLIAWMLMYRPPTQQKRLKQPEFDYIHSDPAESIAKIPWMRLLSHC